jgi:phosphoglucosamine mutase
MVITIGVMRLFGTSGIRRVVDSSLLQLAFEVGLAVGSIYRPIVVGRDTRTSGNALKHAVMAGLLASGSRCFDAGVLPTPTLAWATRHFAAGVMLTASHNPPEYNGIKLLNPDGSAFDVPQQEQIENLVLDSSPAVCWDKIERSGVYDEAIEQHTERILKDFPGNLKLKVVVDCGCGAASVITPYLLRRLGCGVLALNCYPSGFFPHPIEPIESNLGELMKATKEFGADLGIAHDGDSDRMMAVDEKGRFIPGDKLLVVFARALTAREVVTTLDASMAIEEMGFKVRRTRIGDIYVSDDLKNGGDFGGEPSGSWVFPGVSLCPDGIYAAAQVVAIARQQRLSPLVDSIPSYPLRRGSVSSQGVDIASLAPGLMALQPLTVNNTDGIRLGFADGWLLIRPSGTEPKIRITVEAKSEVRLRQLYESGVKAIEECRKG